MLLCLSSAIVSANLEALDTSSDPYDRLLTEFVVSGESPLFANCFTWILKLKGVPEEDISKLLTHFKGQTLVRTMKLQAEYPTLICNLDPWVIMTIIIVFFSIITFTLIGCTCCIKWMCNCKKNDSATITPPNSKPSSRRRKREDTLELNRKRKILAASPSAYVWLWILHSY